MRAAAIPAVVMLSFAAPPAAAEDSSPRRIQLAVSAGYAAPFGEAERGSRVSDTAFGGAPLALDAAYRVTSFVGIAVLGRYSVTIPTLCSSASDCEASLGSDAALAIAARFYVPRVWLISPLVDVGMGYEWLTTRLVDAGATSTRSYGGPVLLSVQLAAPFHLGERWTLGPALGATLGAFTGYELRTNAQSPAGNVPARAPHEWLSLGVRVGFSL
jgi:hypothetical protein